MEKDNLKDENIFLNEESEQEEQIFPDDIAEDISQDFKEDSN